MKKKTEPPAIMDELRRPSLDPKQSSATKQPRRPRSLTPQSPPAPKQSRKPRKRRCHGLRKNEVLVADRFDHDPYPVHCGIDSWVY